tara:strand:+ start:145 stop:591 length:447 start_codon:yes stop_codon:yes gene_type:complete
MWFPKRLENKYNEYGLNLYRISFCIKRENEIKKNIYDFGDCVLDFLDDKIDLEEDAKFFYKWLMTYYIPLCYREYARDLLDYFKWREYLTFKKQIITPKYHKKKRYKVIFYDNKKLFFKKDYTSLRELEADTGKRSCEIAFTPFSPPP